MNFIELLEKIFVYVPVKDVFFRAGIILGFFIFLAFLILFIYNKYLNKIAKKTKTNVDDMLYDHTKKPIFYLTVVYGIKVSLSFLQINGSIIKFVNSLMSLVVLYVVLKGVDILIELWSETLAKRTKSQVDDVLLPLFHKVTNVFFVIVGILTVLKIWDIDITPYLAGVGISGIVLGLALQDSLKNVFGGISMILDKNFNIGDPVQLETGELGKIREIGLRTTKILTFDAEVIFVPNGQLANMRIRNFVKPNTRIRKIVDFSVAYGTNPEKVKKIVMKTLKTMQDIYDDPYMDVIMTTMGDSGLHFKARFWVEWDNGYTKWLEATEKIYLALGKEDIEIPYPTRTVHLKQD